MKAKSLFITASMAVSVVFFQGCKKEGPPGPQGPTGETGPAGPDARTFNFSLTFNPGDTFKSYAGITGFDAGDVVLTYVLYETIGGTGYWTQIPVILSDYVNFVPEFSESTGFLYINSLKADGTAGSPWTSSYTFAFKAVLIKSSGLAKNPNVDLNNYEEVKNTFNIPD